MTRKIWLGTTVLVALAAIIVGNFEVRTAQAQGDVKEVAVSAKKFEFSPAEIRVKAGTRVRLVVTSTDREHGFEVDPFADGADKKAGPGLKFDANVTKPDFKLAQGQAVPIEFTAAQPGTYSFKCSVLCGMGHRNMKGQIIVEP
jgi:cytochrome c oxidase subunit 2|nr:cupredoxin domain-containing protein [Candidatus Acidoferrales bacterium]